MMDFKYLFFLFVIVGVLLEMFGDIVLKSWSINNKTTMLVFGLLLYTASTVFWAFSLRHELLSKAVTIFTVLNLILVVLAGVFLFKEELNMWNKAGIAMGIFSVVLLQI
jgi:multidrug transporter EmrE-like cation transporter